MILRGRWCDIIFLNVHVPTEDKIDDIKDRFYEELEQVFDTFPKYHILIDRRRHSSIFIVRSFRAADCDTDHYLFVCCLIT
jgi:hypothetical protein